MINFKVDLGVSISRKRLFRKCLQVVLNLQAAKKQHLRDLF